MIQTPVQQSVPALPIDSIITNQECLNSTVADFSGSFCGCCCQPKRLVANQNLQLLPNQFNKFSTEKAGYLNVYYALNGYNNSVGGATIFAVFLLIIFIIIGAASGVYGLLALVVLPILCFGGCIYYVRQQLYNVLIAVNSQYLMVFRGTPSTQLKELTGEAYSFDAVPIVLEKYFRHWTTSSGSGNNRRRRHHYAYYISFRISRHEPSKFMGQELFTMERRVYNMWSPCPPDLEHKFQSLKNGEASSMFGFPLLLVSNFNEGDRGRHHHVTRLYERYIVKPLQQGNIGSIQIQGVQLNPNLPMQPQGQQVNMQMQQQQPMMMNQQQQQPMMMNQQQQPMMMNQQQMGYQQNNMMMNQQQQQPMIMNQQPMQQNNMMNQQQQMVNYQQNNQMMNQQQPMQQNQYQGQQMQQTNEGNNNQGTNEYQGN